MHRTLGLPARSPCCPTPNLQLLWEGANGQLCCPITALPVSLCALPRAALLLHLAIVKAIVEEPANGVEGVQHVLAAHDATFEDVFADWLVAVTLD